MRAAKQLLRIAGIKVDDLLPFTDYQRASVFEHLKTEPAPLWLLQAFERWYKKNRPLTPEYMDQLFREALFDLWPKPPVEPGSNRGRKQGSVGKGGFSSPEKKTPLRGSKVAILSPRQVHEETGDYQGRRMGFRRVGEPPPYPVPNPKPPRPVPARGERHEELRHDEENRPVQDTVLETPDSVEANVAPHAVLAGVRGGLQRINNSEDRVRLDVPGAGPCGAFAGSPAGSLGGADKTPDEGRKQTPQTEPSNPLVDSSAVARASIPPTSSRDNEGLDSGSSAGSRHFLAVREVAASAATARGAGSLEHGVLLPAPAPNFYDFDGLDDEAVAVKQWRRFASMSPLPRGVMNAFVSEILDLRPAWLKTPTRGALAAYLRRKAKVVLRERASDEGLAKAKEALATYTLDFASRIEKEGHSKGAYQWAAWGQFRPVLEGLLDVEEYRARAEELLGREVNLSLLEKIFRDRFGGLSREERAAEDYTVSTVGFRPEYAGQVVQIDGSQLPVEVLNGWGRAQKDGDLAQIFLVCTDMGSLRSFIYREANTSEVHLWDGALQEWLFRLGYAPELVIADEIGRSFNAVRFIDEGKAGNLSLGVRLWLAAGVQPYCHKPKHATGKAAVECGGVKSFKATVKRFLSARWAAQFLADAASAVAKNGAALYRQVESEGEWRSILSACESALNARLLQRAGTTRQDAWDADPVGVEKRGLRALAPDARETYKEICSRVQVWNVAGNNKLLARVRGKRAFATLAAPLPEACRDALAIVMPCGLRKGDEQFDGEGWRGVVVEPRKGQPVYHQIEALCAKQSFLGFDLDKPTIHDKPRAIPETRREQIQRAWAGASAPLKEGTNDAPVSDPNDSVLKPE